MAEGGEGDASQSFSLLLSCHSLLPLAGVASGGDCLWDSL